MFPKRYCRLMASLCLRWLKKTCPLWVYLCIWFLRFPLGQGSSFDLDIFEADTPLAGVLTALTTLQYQNYLFTAVDMPLLPKEALLPLLEHACEHESSVFYSINGFLQPFPSLVQGSVVRHILACYHQQLYKLTEVFSSIPHVLLPYTGDLNAFLNVNTWKDWEVFSPQLRTTSPCMITLHNLYPIGYI